MSKDGVSISVRGLQLYALSVAGVQLSLNPGVGLVLAVYGSLAPAHPPACQG